MASRFAGTNQIVERQLTDHLCEIETSFSSNCLLYDGPILAGADDWIRDAVEALANGSAKRKKLVFSLHS
jgi:hypothetical protein